MRPTEHELKEFANALQLSIMTEIKGVRVIDGNVMIEFARYADDDNIRKFAAIVGSSWKKGDAKFVVGDTGKINWPQLTLFLLLTRLNENNMGKFAELDPSARVFTDKLGLQTSIENFKSVKDCSQFIFNVMKEKNMTIRDLATATGLTQVTISNFKAGKDIKLSNFIKIIQVFGLELKLKT